MELEYFGFVENEIALLKAMVYQTLRVGFLVGPAGEGYAMTEEGQVLLEGILTKLGEGT